MDNYQNHVIDSLARLEIQMAALVGNGQPGRIKNIENDIESLKKDRYWAGGVIVGVSTVITAAWHMLFNK